MLENEGVAENFVISTTLVLSSLSDKSDPGQLSLAVRSNETTGEGHSR